VTKLIKATIATFPNLGFLFILSLWFKYLCRKFAIYYNASHPGMINNYFFYFFAEVLEILCRQVSAITDFNFTSDGTCVSTERDSFLPCNSIELVPFNSYF